MNNSLINDLSVRDHVWLLPCKQSFSKSASVLELALVKGIFNRYFPKETIRFEKNANGKPYLINPCEKLQFSLSHTDELIVLAFSLEEVGIDVEKMKYRRYYQALSRKYFREEINCLRHFFYSWCAREAFIKAKGEKIATHLSRITIDLTTRSLFFDNDWTSKHKVNYVYVYPGFLAALSRPETNVKRCAFFSLCRF